MVSRRGYLIDRSIDYIWLIRMGFLDEFPSSAYPSITRTFIPAIRSLPFVSFLYLTYLIWLLAEFLGKGELRVH